MNFRKEPRLFQFHNRIDPSPTFMNFRTKMILPRLFQFHNRIQVCEKFRYRIGDHRTS